MVTLDVPGLSAASLVAVHPTPPYQADGARWRADWDQVLDRLEESYGARVDGRVPVNRHARACRALTCLRELTAAPGTGDVAEVG